MFDFGVRRFLILTCQRLSFLRRAVALAKEDQFSAFETRSLPALTHSYPCHFTFYVAHPIRSIQRFERLSYHSLVTDHHSHLLFKLSVGR
jgi:hypothetical protein